MQYGAESKRKSMSINVFLNGMRTVFSLIFPLITFPYVARVLSPEGIGQANFANSITNYFVLIGALGITAYAIREGAKCCEDKRSFESFANQIWALSILASGVAYLCLFIVLVFSSKLHPYRWLIGIYSLQILTNALGMEWVLNVYEEYAYVAIRSFLFQALSLILLFVFVRKPSDVYWYVAIQTISTAGIGIANHVYVRRRLPLKFMWVKEITNHLPPILLIFSTTLATTVYVNLDTSMLGIIWGDAQVGYYTVAAKLYHIIKALINSVVTVYAVRLSGQYYQNKEEYQSTFQEIFQILIALTIPIAIGGSLLREEIIIILGGREYLEAAASLVLLLISIIPATLGNMLGAGALLIIKKEKSMFAATLVGTVLNAALNYIFICNMKCTGAALATLITEVVVCLILMRRTWLYIKFMFPFKHIIKVVLACALFIPIVFTMNQLVLGFWIQLTAEIILSIFVYVSCLFVMKDEMVLRFAKEFFARREKDKRE